MRDRASLCALMAAVNVFTLVVGIVAGRWWIAVIGAVCLGANIERLFWLTSPPTDRHFGQLALRRHGRR